MRLVYAGGSSVGRVGRRKPRVAGSNPAHRVQRHVQQIKEISLSTYSFDMRLSAHIRLCLVKLKITRKGERLCYNILKKKQIRFILKMVQ